MNDLVLQRRYFLEARAFAHSVKRSYTPETKPNTKTTKSYVSILCYIFERGGAYFDSIGSKSYYNKVCSAVRAAGPYYAVRLIDEYIDSIEKQMPVPRSEVEKFVVFLDLVSRLCEGGDGYGESKVLLTSKILENRYSKLNLLPKLPVGWVGQMFMHALKTQSDNRPLITGIALAANTGARPAEIAVGMKLSQCRGGLRLDVDNKIKTRGAGDRGLGPRWVEMPVNTPSREYLRGVLGLETDIMLRGMGEKAFCDTIIRMGREIFPSLDETVSPY
jgi:hypothetical protein